MDQESPVQSDWLISGDLPCLGDGYNLRGLVGPIVRCPECGHLNDLTDPEPWRKKDLPLGITKREHWPSQATAVGLFMLLLSPCCISVIYSSLRTLTITPLVAFTAVFVLGWGGWFVSAWRFMKSAVSAGRALRVLLLVHLGGAATMIGIASLTISLLTEVSAWIWPLALLTAAGPALLFYVKQDLLKMDQSKQFRVDWRAYSVLTSMHDDKNEN